MALPSLTIGIEEEYQIIDPESRELTSYIQKFLEQGRIVLQEQIKPEFMQSQVEVGSHICRNMAEARQEIVRLRRTVCELAKANGLDMAAASTHPFSAWSDQKITAGERYTKLETDMGEVARRLLIFGMHVHIGIEDKELMIDVMNQARYFMPHVLALSTSSPFWHGRETGLKSYRSVIFEDLPRTGLPPTFSSWADFQGMVNMLIKTNCIEDPTKIWWDIRPHAKFPTLEFRISDICTTVDEAVCIASLYLAITAKLIKLRQSNQSWRSYRHHLITENKWRAVRYGIDGKLIDFGQEQEVPFRFLAIELLELVDDVLDELNIRQEVEFIHNILDNGTSADRQLQVFRQTGDLTAVVDHLVKETQAGLY
jgi:carboxylate-amine ligase